MNSVHNFLFYPRLALTNMKKNASIYRPYLLAGGLLAGLLYVLDSVGVMVEKSQMAGKDIMQVIATMGTGSGQSAAMIRARLWFTS